MKYQWSSNDLEQIEAHGLNRAQLESQLDRFRDGFPYLELCEAATIGNGIIQFSEADINRFIDIYDVNRDKNRIIKFVPASGAASRMFKSLLSFHQRNRDLSWPELEKLAHSGDSNARDVKQFIAKIEKFSFFSDIKENLNVDEITPDLLAENYHQILNFVLGQDGLNLPRQPKAMVPFHSYIDGPRTAIEEHLVEAKEYARGKNGMVNLHFTVTPEHQSPIENLINNKVSEYFEDPTKVEISYSIQQSSTDTIAADNTNNPFRDSNGKLVFRPGGHGTLLQNLQQLDGDIIFIKNIDNVTTDNRRGPTVEFKKALAGILFEIRDRIFDLLRKVDAGSISKNDFISGALTFMSDFQFRIPINLEELSEKQQFSYFMDRLNRPIRIGGMVLNEGEPGGGPFWTKCTEGEHSLQVVETNLIDLNDDTQKKILAESTHFSPVDFLCSLKDFKGNKFDLKKFIDEDTGMISTKYQEGRELKALEVPGLWNGGMSDWLTFFVEVPNETFTPVKTILDLLRPEHQ